MSRRMLINALESEEVRIAVLDDGILQEYYVERESKETLVGNIYKGKVLNVHPGLQAAFVDIGIDKNAFLHASEIPGPITYDEQGRERRPMGEARQIANLVESGQEVLVQVIRDSVDAKGPSVSMDISLPGRYLVLTPATPRVAVSKRISDPGEREGLKRLLLDLHPPEGLGFIIRTAGADRTGNDLQRDLDYLTRVWSAVTRKAKTAAAPSPIYQESDLVIRTIRDMFGPEVSEIVVDRAAVHNRVLEFFETLMPKFVGRVKFYEETEPLFHRYNVESQIEQIYERRVHLKSGGTIVIEPTEALVSIDVNSGKFTRETSPEEMAYRTNMEAAAEIARQLRLRDLGGQIVVDFIDMRDPRHRRNVEQVLRSAIRKDRAQATILRTSRLGLVEMARQKIHAGIRLLSYEACDECKGSGYVKTVESVALGLLRQIRFTLPRHEVTGLKVYCDQDVSHYIVNVKRLDLEEIEKKSDKAVTVLGDSAMPTDRHEILCILHGGTEVPLEEMNFKPLPPPPEPPTPEEPVEEAIEEPMEEGVLEQRSPEPNEWQLPIEPAEGEASEAIRPSTRPVEPDFEEDASRYEERAATAPGTEGGGDEWRSRLTPRPHRRPEAGFHDRRVVRRPVEEPRQPMPRAEEPAQPTEAGPRPAGEEFPRGRGEEGRAMRGEERFGRDEGRGFRGRRGRGWGRDRDDWRRREEGRGFRGREEAERRGPTEGPMEDEWAVEEEFDAQEPSRRDERGPRAPEEGRGMRAPEEGRPPRRFDEERGDLAFGGRQDREGRGFGDDRGPRRRRRGGRGRRRREEGRGPGGYGERDRGPREGGYAPYGEPGEMRRQAPRDEDVNGWEPEGPPRTGREEGRGQEEGRGMRGGFRRDEERGGYRREEGRGMRGGFRRDEGRGPEEGRGMRGPEEGRGMRGPEEGRGMRGPEEGRGMRGPEEGRGMRGGYRREEERGGFRRDEERGGYRREEGRGPEEGRGMRGPEEGRGMRGPEEGRGMRGGFRRDEGRGGYRREEGRGMRGPEEGRAMHGGFRRDEARGPEEGRGMRGPGEDRGMRGPDEGRGMRGPEEDRGMRGGFGREVEPRAEDERAMRAPEEARPAQAPDAAEPMAEHDARHDEVRSPEEGRAVRGPEEGRPMRGRGGFRRGGPGPFRRQEPPPAEDRAPVQPAEEQSPRRDREEVREAPPVQERREAPAPEAQPVEAAAPAPPAPEAAAPAEEEEEIGVGFRRKTTGRRRGTKRRSGKSRGGLGAALESEGGEGKKPPAAE